MEEVETKQDVRAINTNRKNISQLNKIMTSVPTSAKKEKTALRHIQSTQPL